MPTSIKPDRLVRRAEDRALSMLRACAVLEYLVVLAMFFVEIIPEVVRLLTKNDALASALAMPLLYAWIAAFIGAVATTVVAEVLAWIMVRRARRCSPLLANATTS